MFFGILTLVTALAISAVAIYYSVAGLVAIFAAAAIPIMIMGGVLEVAKLVTAVWLHWYWKKAAWWLKTYLVGAVVILMFITSMGIFGFLSKAHIEQTTNATESMLLVEQLNSEIERQESIISRAESNINSIESQTVNADNEIQNQIDREQTRIDSAFARIQPAIDEQLAIIQRADQDKESRLQPLINQINEIDQTLQDLQTALAENNVRRAQGIIGVRQDNDLGPATRSAIEQFRAEQIARRDQLAERIDAVRNEPNTSVDNARAEMSRIRSIAEQQIADSDRLISRLRAQLGQSDQTAMQSQVNEQLEQIRQAKIVIDTLLEQKSSAEKEYRLIEAEVGPIKYIAEFVYGDSDKDLLEEAVRWVILIIIFVFDPLAVLLLIASQYTFEYERKRKEEKQEKENVQTEQLEHNEDQNFESTATKTNQAESTSVRARHERRSLAVSREKLENQRTIELAELDDNAEWKEAKHQWKEDHPDQTIKEFKEAYIQGDIDKLPWEGYIQNSEQNASSIWNRLNKRDE
jgi:hypothetical protein